MIRFEHFELAPGVVLQAALRRGALHALVLESDDLCEDFLARYLADLSGGGGRGEIVLEEVRDAAGRPCRLRDLPEARVRGYFAQFVGFILRDGGMIDALTVRENLLLPFRYAHVWPRRAPVDDGEVARRLAAVLDFADAPDVGAWLDRRPPALTMVQRRLAGFVRTYVRQPELIIAFAPCAGLDASARGTLWACVQRYRALRPDCTHLFVLGSRDELRGLPPDVTVVELTAAIAAAPVSPLSS